MSAGGENVNGETSLHEKEISYWFHWSSSKRV